MEVSGPFWEHFGSILDCFWESCLSILFVRVGRQNLALCWSFSNLVFMFCPEFPKMAEIVPNRELLIHLQLFISRASFQFSLEPWQNGVGDGLDFRCSFA